MDCPKCAAAVPDKAVECPACGVIFEKLRKAEERRRKSRGGEPSAPSVPGEPALTPAPALAVDPKTARLVAVAIVLLWIAAFAWYMSRHPAGRRRSGAVSPGTTVQLRDPDTGDLKSLKVESAEQPADAAAPAAPAAAKSPDKREATWIEEERPAKP
ncbi:MAG: zinc ribbon domain-containing protein [Elusimicrobia bacterium]|nr:zinc ribbon domain-containing protein [Elusimicrobiota bacterium]